MASTSSASSASSPSWRVLLSDCLGAPRLSADEEAALREMRIKAGSRVARGQPVGTVVGSGDKETKLRAPAAGRVERVLVAKGDKVGQK